MQSYRNDNNYILQQRAGQIARKGKPVFPCRGKEPLTKRGFYDATTDPGRVAAYWKKHPQANIAVPGGARSGFFVLDRDRLGALEELEQELGQKLPETLVIRTPSGGHHLYFQHVDGITTKTGRLPHGIDVRGEGGYVLVPPSPGYTVEHKAPIAPAPEGLVELIKEKPQSTATVAVGCGYQPKVHPGNADPILEGTRNITLTSIAGYLHDGTRDLAELTGDLLQINAAKCTPPLETTEVEGLAKSIHQLAPCKKGPRSNPPTQEAIGMLGDILNEWWHEDWRGPGGKSERDLALTYIMFAVEGGAILPNGGILVDISHHQAAERARKSSSTAYNAFRRLSVKGWCRGGGNGPDRREDQPAGIVLLPRPNSAKERKAEHPNQGEAGKGRVFGFALPTARRGRHSAPGMVRVASASRIAAIDHLERFDSFTLERTLADAMGIAREYDLRRRYLEPLEARGVVERREEQRIERRGKRRIKRTVYWWRLSEGWQSALERVFAEEEELERHLYSGLTSDERQKKRREESRERWRGRDNVRPESAPTSDELRQRRVGLPGLRQRGIQTAIARLFAEQPEYRGRRVGQVTCALAWHLPEDFPRGVGGVPKDEEVGAILDGVEVSPATVRVA